MALVDEHGAAVVALCIDEEGQARTAEWKVRVAERLIDDLTDEPRHARVETSSSTRLTFPITTGQEEVRRDALETIEAIRELKRRHPDVQTTLGVSNVSFGLNPAARQVLNSVFLHECVNAGSRHRDRVTRRRSCRWPRSTTSSARSRSTSSTTGAARATTRCSRFMELFEGVSASSAKAGRAEELAALPLFERLERRIVDGERNGLEADLDAALESPARAGDHQRHAAGRHEDRRRAVRLRPDAAAVRARSRPR